MEDWVTKIVLGAIGLLVTYFIKSLLDNLKLGSLHDIEIDILKKRMISLEKQCEKCKEAK